MCHSWVATVDVKIFLHTLDRTLPRTLVLTATLARIRLNDPLNRSLLPERSRYGIVLPVFRSDSTPFPGPVAILARTVYHSYPQILRTSRIQESEYSESRHPAAETLEMHPQASALVSPFRLLNSDSWMVPFIL